MWAHLAIMAAFRLTAFVVRMTWRWWTGAHLDGLPRTDAGWLVRGTTALAPHGRASRWAYLPRLHRAAWRAGGTLGAFVLLYGMTSAPELTMGVIGTAVLAVGVYFGIRGYRAIRLYRHTKTIVQPTYIAVRQILGERNYPVDQMRKLLSVPLDYAENPESRIVLALPATFGGDSKVESAVTRIMQQKLGVELDGHWSYMGDPHVEYTLRPRPPQSVSYADIRDRIEAAEDGEAVIGLGSRGETISVYLDTETPHIGMSIGTGGGKSSTLRGMIAQYIRQGAEVIICDVGVISLREFEGVPGVTIVTDVADIWAMVDRVHAEMERRYKEWERNPSTTFRRQLFVLEEGNDFYMQSIALWNEIREKKDPATPPVFMKMAQFTVKSRKVKQHFIGVYQNMDARTVGGGSAVAGPLIRAQFGMKILARFTPQTWAFLVGTNPRPKSSRHPGRAIVMVGDDMRVTQMAYWEPEEARAVALGDRTPVSVTPEDVTPMQRQDSDTVTPVSRRPSLYVVQGGASDDSAAHGNNDAEIEEGTVAEGATIAAPPRRYTLAEAAEERIIPMSYGALRQAKSQAKKNGRYFPTGRTVNGVTKYTASELNHWYKNRRKSASGE